MADIPEFIKQQYAFAAHIRNSDAYPRPNDVEERRMKIYRELFYNNVEGSIASTFPVLRKITLDDRWHAMVRDFYSNHHSHTPLFPELPGEFLKYLELERTHLPDDPPFLLELAHYEWVELALSLLDHSIDSTSIDPQGDLLQGVPVLSPFAWPLTYRFPVHKIGPAFLPTAPDTIPTHLLVYRDNNFTIHFIDINPVTARLLDLINNHSDIPGENLLRNIATELGHLQPDNVIQGGLTILNDLKKRDVLLGVRR